MVMMVVTVIVRRDHNYSDVRTVRVFRSIEFRILAVLEIKDRGVVDSSLLDRTSVQSGKPLLKKSLSSLGYSPAGSQHRKT